MNKKNKKKLNKWLDAQAYCGHLVDMEHDGDSDELNFVLVSEMKKYLPELIDNMGKENGMSPLQNEVIGKAKRLVINQARYIYPSDGSVVDDMLCDAMYVAAEDMTDGQTATYLDGKDIISDDKLTALVEKMGVEDLYHEDHWIDNVATYIIENKDDCETLWNYIKEKC